MSRKLSQFFNIKSFKDFKNSAENAAFKEALRKEKLEKKFKDASPGLLIKENLQHIDPTIFEKKYPSLAFLNSGVSADNTGGYSEVIKSLRTQPEGSFKTSGDKSDNKGKISLAGETSFIEVTGREAESKWSDTELAQAAMQGINLQQRFIQSHSEIYQREVDEIIALGVEDKAGSVGLLNNALFATSAASGAIGTLSGQQKYDEIAALITDQHNQVNNTPEYMADRVMLPTAIYNDLNRSILNSAGSERTVLSALRLNFPEVQFLASFRGNDIGGSSRVVAYASGEQAMKIRIPVPLTVSQILPLGFKYHVESKYRIAGMDILESTAGRFLTGL